MKIALVILNWKGAERTLACLDSVLKSYGKTIKIIIVDNNSEDGSLYHIADSLRNKKQPYRQVKEKDAKGCLPDDREVWITLVQNEGNYGYAGGNNIGIKLAVSWEVSYIWILNNDTLVNENSLPALLEAINSNSKIGFAGSVLCYEDRPNIIQACGGGRIYPYLGKARLYMKNLPVEYAENAKDSDIDYLMGASLLIKSNMVKKVGLMDESYFMYSEEVDWQRRASNLGWKIKIAKDSFVLHGDSSSTRSHMFHYYRNRAAVMFTKRHYGAATAMMACCCLSGITILQNLLYPLNIAYGIKGVIEGIRYQGKKHAF